MAYKKGELKKKAIELIEKYKLFTVDGITGMMMISRDTYYRHGLDKDKEITEKIWHTKELMKAGLRKKWYESDNPTVQVALYKLLGSEDECHRLNASKQQFDITSGGQPIAPVINFTKPEKSIEDLENENFNEDEEK